jgi:hypothetical protein
MSMRKAFVPLLASLLLCSAATGVLVATTAKAQTEARKPMMVNDASVMMAQNTATPPNGRGFGGMHRPSPADMTARHKQRCEDRYARDVGRMAYLEARLGLTGPQQSLFSAWKAVKLDIAKRGADACAQRPMDQAQRDTSPVDRMARMEDRLKKRIADLDAERPAFAALYNGLSADQRKALTPHHHGMHRGMGRRHMMDSGMMRRGMMGRPMNGQQPPTPPPQ